MWASLRGMHTQHPITTLTSKFSLVLAVVAVLAIPAFWVPYTHAKTGKYIKIIVHFLLHHTAYYIKKIIFAQLCTSSALLERVTQREEGGVARWVLYTWQLLR